MGTRLYVGNLPYTTDEGGLRALFGDGQEGRQVTQVKIITDRESGRSRGFAFVQMGNDAEAAAASQELAGRELQGRPINVSEARERALHLVAEGVVERYA